MSKLTMTMMVMVSRMRMKIMMEMVSLTRVILMMMVMALLMEMKMTMVTEWSTRRMLMMIMMEFLMRMMNCKKRHYLFDILNCQYFFTVWTLSWFVNFYGLNIFIQDNDKNVKIREALKKNAYFRNCTNFPQTPPHPWQRTCNHPILDAKNVSVLINQGWGTGGKTRRSLGNSTMVAEASRQERMEQVTRENTRLSWPCHHHIYHTLILGEEHVGAVRVEVEED